MPRLVFHAADPEFIPANMPALVNALQQYGFIGEKWNSPSAVKGERYLIGDAFLSQVTFMGCAPAIELEPIVSQPESTDFCHLEIEPVLDTIKFVRGSDHLVSRCPLCRQRHANWEVIPQNLRYHCDKCQADLSLAEFDWKNTAGCGRFFISLHGIYPQEAIPTSHLLATMEKITGTAWKYFYIQ